MAGTPIYDKTLKFQIFLSGTRSLIILKLGMNRRGQNVFKVYINDDPRLTLIYFTARSNLVTLPSVLMPGQ